MSLAKRVSRNVLYLTLAQLISYVLLFFYGIYAARYLGVENFGILSFAIAVAGVLSVFMDFGFGTLAVRELSRQKELAQKYVSNIFLLKIILSSIIFAFFSVFGFLKGITFFVLAAVIFGVFASNFANTFFAVFQAYEDLKYQSIGRILSSLTLFLVIPISYYFHLGLRGFAAFYGLAYFIVFIYAFFALRKFVKIKLEFDIAFCKTLVKDSLPYGLASLLSTICFWADSIMLSYFQGNVSVGIYNAAYRIVFVLLVIPTIFGMAFFPTLSRLYKENSHKFVTKYFLKSMFLLSLPIGVGITVLAERIISLVFGQEYSLSAMALKLLVWSAVFIFLNTVYTNYLGSINAQKEITKTILIGTFLNVALNALFIPKYSFVGASLTTIATEAFMFAVFAIQAHKYHFDLTRTELSWATKATLASFVMGLFIYIFYSYNLIILIFSAAVLYFGVLFLIRGIDSEDIALIKKVF
jgi:O-antigen/teichoic acid export membrane protein